MQSQQAESTRVVVFTCRKCNGQFFKEAGDPVNVCGYCNPDWTICRFVQYFLAGIGDEQALEFVRSLRFEDDLKHAYDY